MPDRFPEHLSPATLDVMARAMDPTLGGRVATLLALRVSTVEKHGLLTEQLLKAYREGIKAGWRLAYNATHPKGS